MWQCQKSKKHETTKSIPVVKASETQLIWLGCQGRQGPKPRAPRELAANIKLH